MARKARRAGATLFEGPARRFLLTLSPPLIAGGALTLALERAGQTALLPGVWLLLYGTAVVTGGAFADGEWTLASKAGLDKILVVLDLTGPVIPEFDLKRMIGKLAAFDIDRFRVAIVQTRHERQNQDELGVLLAMEQGISARVFPDEASALLWLRHGAR